MPPFFLKGVGFNCAGGCVGPGSAANLGCDRYDEETSEGEKPRTILGDLIRQDRDGSIPEDETLVSDALRFAASLSLPSGAVVEHDSVE